MSAWHWCLVDSDDSPHSTRVQFILLIIALARAAQLFGWLCHLSDTCKACVCREMEVEKAGDMLVHLSRMGTRLTACVPMRLAAQSELVQVRSLASSAIASMQRSW